MSPATPRLEKNLVLHSYLCSLFGRENFGEFQKLLRDVREGFDEEGHSHLFHALIAQESLKLKRDDLERYDENIRRHLAHLNQRRHRPIVLKYF